jgi:NADH-quinone oxidoreductase subunit L
VVDFATYVFVPAYAMAASGLLPVGFGAAAGVLVVVTGAYVSGVFHLVTHAFFKALLFLGAGSVIHGMHDEQDMRRMGALRKWMPITAGTFIVGWLAIAGIVPLSGFWSKDEILASAWASHNYALWAVGVVAAVITAFYMTRQVYLVFYGNERWSTPHEELVAASVGYGPPLAHEASPDAPAHEADESGAGSHDDLVPQPHESPWLMTFPLVVLAGLAVLGGLFNLPFRNENFDILTRWLEPVFRGVPQPEVSSFGLGFALSTIALVAAVSGIVLGRAFYRNGLPANLEDPVAKRVWPVAKVLANAYYFDAGIAKLVRGPVTAFARFLSDDVDRKGIDGAVNGIARGFRAAGGGLRRIQTGLVRNYALGIVFGTVLLLGYIFVRAVS